MSQHCLTASMQNNSHFYTNMSNKQSVYSVNLADKQTPIVSRLFAAVCIMLAALYWVADFNKTLELASVACILVLSLLLCVRTRNNTLLFLISIVIAYSNYSAMVANYSEAYALQSTYDTMYQGTWIAAEGTFILLLFMAVLMLCLPSKIEIVNFGDFFCRYQGRHSVALVFLLSLILLIIWATSSSGFEDTGGRGESNQLFEYSYIFFIIGFYFAAQRKVLQNTLICIAILYILQNVLTGNRAGVLAIILLLYALYISQRYSTKQILPFLIIGIIIFMLIGVFREKSAVSISGILGAVSKLFSKGLVWDTASFAYHQGLAFVRLAQDANYGQIEYLTGQWFAGIVLGGTGAPDSMLSIYAQKLYPGMGGGFIPFYFNCYFGTLGTVATGLVVSLVYRLVGGVTPMNSDLSLMIRLSLFVTVFRWYLYSPAPLSRGVLLVVLVCGVMLFVAGKTSSIKRTKLAGMRQNVPSRQGGWSDASISDVDNRPSACIGSIYPNAVRLKAENGIFDVVLDSSCIGNGDKS